MSSSAPPPSPAGAAVSGFEGPEKRIEINFAPLQDVPSSASSSTSPPYSPSSPLATPAAGLRSLPSSLWHSVVNLLNGRCCSPSLPQPLSSMAGSVIVLSPPLLPQRAHPCLQPTIRLLSHQREQVTPPSPRTPSHHVITPPSCRHYHHCSSTARHLVIIQLTSSSSLFVFPLKVIILTCGCTTPLACLAQVIAAAASESTARATLPQRAL